MAGLVLSHLAKQPHEFLHGQHATEAGVPHDAGDLVVLARLQPEDVFVDGALRGEPRHVRALGLAAAVGAAEGLLFDGRVPPGVDHHDASGHGEVEADAAGGEGGEEDVELGGGAESFDLGVARGGGQSAVVEEVGPALERADAGEDLHHGDELRVDDDFRAGVLGQPVEDLGFEGLGLGRGEHSAVGVEPGGDDLVCFRLFAVAAALARHAQVVGCLFRRVRVCWWWLELLGLGFVAVEKRVGAIAEGAAVEGLASLHVFLAVFHRAFVAVDMAAGGDDRVAWCFLAPGAGDGRCL